MSGYISLYGQQVALAGSFTNLTNPVSPLTPAAPSGYAGGIAKVGTRLRLYTNSTTIDRTVIALTQPVSASYAELVVGPSDWTILPPNHPGNEGLVAIQLASKKFAAVSGAIAGPIYGVYLADSVGNVLAWWPLLASVASIPMGQALAAVDISLTMAS